MNNLSDKQPLMAPDDVSDHEHPMHVRSSEIVPDGVTEHNHSRHLQRSVATSDEGIIGKKNAKIILVLFLG
jgi:hypothetical protein